MQPLDVQNDMQPVNYAEAVKLSTQQKKVPIEPDRKGVSFLDMIKKLTADKSDVSMDEDGLVVQEPQIAEKLVSKADDAVAKRVKLKSFQKKDDTAIVSEGQSEADVVLHDEADSILVNSHTGREELYSFNFESENIQNEILAHIEAETVSDEEASILLTEETIQPKKHKSTAAGAASVSFLQADDTAYSLLKEEPETADSENRLFAEQTAKVHQAKQQKPVFTIIDERTVQFAPVSADGSIHEAGVAVRAEQMPSIDMVAEFRGNPAAFAQKSEGGVFLQENTGESFSLLFAQQLQDMSADFVQAGKIILQDNNAGLIRLQLQPAHLGNVKINLELVGDKKIVGKIVTGSKEAYEAFKESIGQLAEAFEQGGFTSAQFDVSWSGESGGGQHFAEDDAAFKESLSPKDRVEVMQGNQYADTQFVYSFSQNQAVNVLA